MSKVHREVWVHVPTGLVWIVEFVDGDIVRCWGPLLRSDTDAPPMHQLEFEARDAVRIRERAREFKRVDPLKPHFSVN